MKRGFTLIEIIISVVIIAIVTLSLAKINRQNANMVDYVTTRNKYELTNTLFLTQEAAKYNKSEKDAYTLLSKMGIKNSDVRMYLKNLKRKIYVDDDIPTEKMIVPVNLKAIMLKSQFLTQHISHGIYDNGPDDQMFIRVNTSLASCCHNTVPLALETEYISKYA